MNESELQITRGNGKDILLQGFHWNLTKTKGTGTIDGKESSWYKVLTSKAKVISELGCTILYLPPPWIDESHWEGNGKHGGGEGYFWHDFDLNSRYGSKAELVELVSTLHQFNIKAIVDIVLNHRDKNRMKSDLWAYPGPHWRAGGKENGGAFLDGSCDLRIEHPEVYSRFKIALNELLEDCKIDGWRWDFVWGYHPKDVLSLIKDTTREEYFSVGEYWQSASISDDPMFLRYGGSEKLRIIGWANDSGCAVFDMILKKELNSGNPANFKYGINCSENIEERKMSVTLVDNHDTGASPYSTSNGWGQKVWECPAEFKSRAYAFILSMPGTPCIYWPDFFDWDLREIADLISVRKQAGIVSGSEWIDLTNQYSGFAAIVKNEAKEETLAISILSNFSPDIKIWKLAAQKEGTWSVWLKK
jgi:glucan 1,4-alpha-maltotetraohydrolase